VIASLLAILTGCYDPHAAPGIPCGPGGACPFGQSCDFGASPPACQASVRDAGPSDVPGDIAVDASPCADITCPATAPICEAATGVCRGCVADAECGTVGACTEFNGQCVADADTIYIAPAGSDSGTCTSGQPCATIQFALGQVTSTRLTIRVGDGGYSGIPGLPVAAIGGLVNRVVISGLRLDWSGGAILSASSNGVTNPAVVTTSTTTNIVIEGVSIANGGTDGIRTSGVLLLSHVNVDANHGAGVLVQSGATSTHVWSSTIQKNFDVGIDATGTLEILRSSVLANSAGGITARSGSVTIASTIVANNGTTSGTIGGIDLHQLAGLSPSLQFDTIANNAMRNSASAAGGLMTDTSATIAIDSSILYGNLTGADTEPAQLSDTVAATYCLFSGIPPAGVGDFAGPPAFVDGNAMNYHITSPSLAHGNGNPLETIKLDVDGEPRPQGNYDIGADEIP
jgi:hypothetical protein